MSSARRRYSAELKVKVVLEVLEGRKSMAQLSREHRISHDQISRWRQEFLARAPLLFTGPAPVDPQQARIAELERLVGQLTVELAAAKKLLPRAGSPSLNNGRS